MTEDAELAGELLRRCELQVAPDPFESDDEDVDWRTWKPKSRDFAPSTFAHSGGSGMVSFSYHIKKIGIKSTRASNCCKRVFCKIIA